MPRADYFLVQGPLLWFIFQLDLIKVVNVTQKSVLPVFLSTQRNDGDAILQGPSTNAAGAQERLSPASDPESSQNMDWSFQSSSLRVSLQSKFKLTQ